MARATGRIINGGTILAFTFNGNKIGEQSIHEATLIIEHLAPNILFLSKGVNKVGQCIPINYLFTQVESTEAIKHLTQQGSFVECEDDLLQLEAFKDFLHQRTESIKIRTEFTSKIILICQQCIKIYARLIIICSATCRLGEFSIKAILVSTTNELLICRYHLGVVWTKHTIYAAKQCEHNADSSYCVVSKIAFQFIGNVPDFFI